MSAASVRLRRGQFVRAWSLSATVGAVGVALGFASAAHAAQDAGVVDITSRAVTWIDEAGEPSWSYAVKPGREFVRAPIVALDSQPEQTPGVVVLTLQRAHDDALVALDGATGKVLWTMTDRDPATMVLHALGVGDQNADAREDVLIAQVDHATLRTQVYLLDGASGGIVRAIAGDFFDVAAVAAEGTPLLSRADANVDGVVTGDELSAALDDEAQQLLRSGTPIDLGEVLRAMDPDEALAAAPVDPTLRRAIVGEFFRNAAASVGASSVRPSASVLHVDFGVLELLPQEVAAVNAGYPTCSDVRANPDYRPVSNGCGSETNWLSRFLPNLSPYLPLYRRACDNHDFCYATCGTSRATCDNNFYNDMYLACQSVSILMRWQCYSHAYLFYQAVNQFGADSFAQGQRESCICCSGPSPHPACPRATRRVY